MQYLLDTVTIVRHFSQHGSIGKSAAHILDSASSNGNQFVISVVSLMEIMYLAERNRIRIDLQETLSRIEATANYAIVDLDTEILRTAETIKFPELHDRLILATAKWLEIPILSSDQAFDSVENINAIWD